MDPSSGLVNPVDEWKNKRFRDYEITMDEACESLANPDMKPLVDVRPVKPGSSRYILYNSKDNKVAVLCHAGVWLWGSDYDTGNFVPVNETAPSGLPEGRIQSEISYKCEYSYAFDTATDTSFYDNMEALEKLALSKPGFNRGNRKRRQWQDGKVQTNKQKYIFASKIFAKNSGPSGKVQYDIHPWVLDAVADQKDGQQWKPNPEKAKILSYANDIMMPIGFSNEPVIRKGDVVWISFKMAFGTVGDFWGPEIIPLEIIKVGRRPENVLSTTEYTAWPSPDNQWVDIPVGQPIKPLEGSTKRKITENDDEEDGLSDYERKNKNARLSEPDDSDDHVMVYLEDIPMTEAVDKGQNRRKSTRPKISSSKAPTIIRGRNEV